MKVISRTDFCEGTIRNGLTGYGKINEFSDTDEMAIGNCVNLYEVEKQEILGFGGAFTEGAAYNYAQMSEENKKRTLELLFGESGLRYNLCRVTIGSCDFSCNRYSYVEEGDDTLKTFSIERDKKYVIPFIKDATAYSKEEILLFASPWSPSAFMKDNNTLVGGGKLKKEYYPIYAEYVAKFIEAYAKEGIRIFAVTLQNEPDAAQSWESCLYTAEEEAEYALVLSESLKRHGLDVKLLCWDHNKGDSYHHAKTIYGKAGAQVWGLGFHWYNGEHFEECNLIRTQYPDKVLLETEFCGGFGRYYGDYRNEIMKNLTHGVNGSVEWNLLLDQNGAPYHDRSCGCVTPVYYDTEKQEVKTHGIYNHSYVYAHYIRRGARVLWTSTYKESVPVLAVKNPDDTIVVIVRNDTEENRAINLKTMDHKIYSFSLMPNTTSVIELRE